MEEMMEHNDQRSALINELLKGQEFARQLKHHLQHPSSPLMSQRCLLEKILACFNHGLSVASSSQGLVGVEPSPVTTTSPIMSPGSTQEYQCHHHPDPFQAPSKKRKTLPCRMERIKVESVYESTLGIPHDDGYSWRKYGQKDILGAKFPRGYYRCTYRKAQGCIAKKQVQRSDEDSSMVEVIYRGHHTCNFRSSNKNDNPPMTLKPSKAAAKAKHIPKHETSRCHQEQEMLLNTAHRDHNFPPVTFSSALPQPEILDDFISYSDNGMAHCFSPAFVSPDTSESNYFSCFMAQCSENDYNEGTSGSASVIDSPVRVLDLSLDQIDSIDANFSFDDDPELFEL